MGRKKSKEDSAPTSDLDARVSIREFLRDVPPRELERVLMQALAVGALCLSHPGSVRKRHSGAKGTDLSDSVREALSRFQAHSEAIDAQATEELDDESEPERHFSQTIDKGVEYEREIATILQDWALATGGRAEHVGADNRPGDVVVAFPSTGPANEGLRVVVEVRNRRARMGRKAVSTALAGAMAARSAEAAIYLSRTSEGLGQDLGDWAEGACSAGPFIACTHEHLTTALRYLYASKKIARLRRASAEVDEGAIQSQIVRIRTALDGIRKVSRLSNAIRSATWEMDDEIDRLRQEIRDALAVVEDALQHRPLPTPKAAP